MPAANPNCWPGTNVPRTFASAFSSTPVDVRSMQITQNLRAGAAQGVETKEKRKGSGGKWPGSNAGKLRALLATGPKTCAELAAASGISNKLVSPLLQHDVKHGYVVIRRDCKPMRYSMADSYSLPRKS